MRKVTYPDAGIQKVFFDGGLNSKFEKSIIKDNESPDCLNVVFENGSVATRGGTSKLNTTAVGSFSFDGLYTREDKSGAETMVAWANGTAYALGGTTFTAIASSVSIFTAGVRVCATQAENYIFFGNGGSTPYKYNGYFTRHGIPQASAPSVALATHSAGALSGAYSYKVTYVNSASVEGDVSAAASAPTAAGNHIDVTIPVAPASFGVNARRIYRTESDGTTYKFLTVISDNTTTLYHDDNADSTLGANAPTDQGQPPNYSVVVFHPALQRLFFVDPANENYVWYSEAANPYVVKATNFDRFGDKSTDIIKTLTVIDNYMLVGGENNHHLWYFPSNDPADWLKFESRTAFGNISPFGNCVYDDGILAPVMQNNKFVGYAKFSGKDRSISSTILTINTVGSETYSEAIEPIIFLTQLPQNISAISFKNKIYIGFTYGAGQTANNRVLVFDYSYSRLSKSNTFSWALWDGMTPVQFTIYGGKLYYATSSATGFVYEMNTSTYNDNGSAINSYYYTKDFYGYARESSLHKDFRNLLMLVDKAGAYYMNISSKIDSDLDDGVNQQISLNPGGSLWDSMVWDRDIWGGGKAQEDIMVDLGQVSGKRIQFKFSNQNAVNQRFKVHYMSFTYNVKGMR